MSETKKYQKKNETSEMEVLPFPLDEEKPAGFKKGANLTETLNNLREYKRAAEEKKTGEEPAKKEKDETLTADKDKLKKEFEAALAKEREINETLKARIEELSQELEKGRNKKYTQEEFEQEAIKTFILVKDVLLVEMKRTDPISAGKQKDTVNAIFSTLTDYPAHPKEGEKDE